MRRPEQFTIGIDLGSATTRIGLYKRDMKLLDSWLMSTQVAAGPEVCVDRIAGALRALLNKSAVPRSRVLGVGVGSPGPFYLQSGILGLRPNFPGWDRFPLRDELARVTHLPIVLESNANATAMAEWQFGAGRKPGLQSLAMIGLDPEVGSGIVLRGEIWHGTFNTGGDASHTVIESDGLTCECGARGCLESYASASVLARLAREISNSAGASGGLRELTAKSITVTAEDIAALARQGDRGAMLVFERLGRSLGVGIINLVNTVDLQMIVLGSGVESAWDFFASTMYRSLREHNALNHLAESQHFSSTERTCAFIRPALLGSSAGLIGAAMLPYMTFQLPVR